MPDDPNPPIRAVVDGAHRGLENSKIRTRVSHGEVEFDTPDTAGACRIFFGVHGGDLIVDVGHAHFDERIHSEQELADEVAGMIAALRGGFIETCWHWRGRVAGARVVALQDRFRADWRDTLVPRSLMQKSERRIGPF